MPTYEYVCTTCGTPLEVVQSIHEPSLTECPSCDGGRLRKVFGNVGVVFKGSGFYRTDNRSRSGAAQPASKGEGTSTSPTAAGTADAATAGSAKDSSGASKKAPATTGEAARTPATAAS